MPVWTSRNCLMLTVAAELLVIAGCGPAPKPTGNLQGTVTFEGGPVEMASIQIRSQSTGEAFAAKIGDDGSYKFDHPVTTGEYAVSVTPDFEMPPAGSVPANEIPKPPARDDIPEKYRDPAKSGVVVEVSTGENTFNVEMTQE